jgi:arginyl-tRNA synthetase
LNKKVVVEYSSPNIAKPFTVGHLRSTIIGDAIANLLEANGWKVYRDNHLGDWGTQFGKQIYAIKTWGDEEKIEKSENPVKELVALYVKFHDEVEKSPELEDKAREWFKKLEDGNKEARRLWKKCIEWSLKEFKTIYEKLGIKFTENDGLGYGESFFEDKIKDVLDELNSKKLLRESEGARLVFFDKDKYPPLMIMKKDGATLYATRDLATDKFRLEKYPGAKIINEVGVEQTLYFRQLFEVEKMLGWVKEGQRIHIRHGHYRFNDEKMSTRKGNTIWLEDVLEEAVKGAEQLGSEGREIAEQVGIGALKWNDLKRSSHLDIVFDWDEILNMQGDSGPYIQYTFARTQSVLSKMISGKKKATSKKELSFARSDLAKLEAEEVGLLRTLSKFPEVVEEAGDLPAMQDGKALQAGKFAPNILCNYLFDLAQKFNLFYQKHKILESEKEEFRIALTAAVGQVIKKGLNLLGIQAPERM